jgi:hypothetical protein
LVDDRVDLTHLKPGHIDQQHYTIELHSFVQECDPIERVEGQFLYVGCICSLVVVVEDEIFGWSVDVNNRVYER